VLLLLLSLPYAGVLYHLFGRHLDTGLPAPYSDDHWRQVVSRLGLSKHQVRRGAVCTLFGGLKKSVCVVQLCGSLYSHLERQMHVAVAVPTSCQLRTCSCKRLMWLVCGAHCPQVAGLPAFDDRQRCLHTQSTQPPGVLQACLLSS
jgi:hypothetical protein